MKRIIVALITLGALSQDVMAVGPRRARRAPVKPTPVVKTAPVKRAPVVNQPKVTPVVAPVVTPAPVVVAPVAPKVEQPVVVAPVKPAPAKPVVVAPVVAAPAKRSFLKKALIATGVIAVVAAGGSATEYYFNGKENSYTGKGYAKAKALIS